MSSEQLPRPETWAMRQRSLPDFPPVAGWSVRTWQAPHPSPTYAHVRVWWRTYYKPQLHDLLQRIYTPAVMNEILGELPLSRFLKKWRQ